MALQKEIWINGIVEALRADNTFIARSVDHSEFISYKTVHVPNAGADAAVVMNRNTFPATITTRGDVDLDYAVQWFSSDPIIIREFSEDIELSYNKRESIISSTREKMKQEVSNYILSQWLSGASLVNTGATVRDTVKELKSQMDSDDVPFEGRNLLLASDTYNELLDELSDAATVAFLTGGDPVTGRLGKYMGFDIYSRSTVASNNGLAWWSSSVSRAISDVKINEDEGKADWYGTVFSFEVRAGGAVIRNDGKGVLKF
jgi:hypothetical protein